MKNQTNMMSRRYRGLLPVVVDVETAGLNPEQDALLEIAAVNLNMDAEGRLFREETLAFHVEPFAGANIDAQALEITRIDPTSALRFALPERQVLERLFDFTREQLAKTGCYRAVLVGQNAWFDLSFMLAANKRCRLTNSPFHSFTTFDTAALSALALGETVLARALRRARIPFDIRYAHSAIYDVERTADLFCHITNRFLR